MRTPLVSIICICFNQKPYVEAAILSALRQTHKNTELVVIDDASTDGSPAVIQSLSKRHGFRALLNRENTGNCRAFNKAYSYARGAYLIDLAGDDVLHPKRVQLGLEEFERHPANYGVHFCNVENIDANGRHLGYFYPANEPGSNGTPIPTGDVYASILEKHFISAPSMMFRRTVVAKLGGYDESLSYEDFDFWVRSSRYFKYCYSAEPLVQKRILFHSHGSARREKKNPHILSTAKVCEKALSLNQNAVENAALAQRCAYELKWALATDQREAAEKFLTILDRLHKRTFQYFAAKMILFLKIPLNPLSRIFLKQKKP